MPPEAAGIPRRANATSDRLARHSEFALLIFVIALGVGLRVAHFFTTGSFFYDEACIALNLVTRHPGQLLEPLAYNQAAAPGFLFLEKCLIHFFGTSELVFRLPALLGSIAVLILLAIFCEKLFNRSLAIFAVAILAVSPLAITMASELKPYSTDAAFTLWMMIRFRSLFLNPTSRKQWLLFFLPGVLALLFSQTIIFVLLSLGLLLIVVKFRESRSAVKAGLVVAIWSGIFLLVYFTIYRFEGNTFYMQTWWSANMLSILKPQFAARAITALSNLFPLSLDSLAYLHERGLILLSALGLYFTAKRVGTIWAAALALPYAAVILASALGLFPIAPRLLLFIIPLLVVLASSGLESLIAKALPQRFYALCCGLAVFLLIGNGTRLTYAQQRDHFPRLSKSLISQVEAAPDCAAVYVFADSVPAWDFYTRDVGTEGMPRQDTYQRIVDRNSERVFAQDPKPILPEALRVYRLGCKPVILGELRLRGIGDSGLRQAWARSELIRMKNSGASSAYIFGELYWRDDLEALLNEARSMGASAKTLGGGRPFLGYLGKIEFASNEKVVSPLQPNE
jgi:hypothetical protein